MSRQVLRSFVALALITGVRCEIKYEVGEPDEYQLALRASKASRNGEAVLDDATTGKGAPLKPATFQQPVATPTLYSQGVMGKPEIKNPGPDLNDWLATKKDGGSFTPPKANPTLYSQGVLPANHGKVGIDNLKLGRQLKIGKGLIGKGALLGGPYVGPIAKPSLYSQGIKGRDSNWAGWGEYKAPVSKGKTFDATGTKPKEQKYSFWLKLVIGGPYDKPVNRFYEAPPAEEPAASEAPVADAPAVTTEALAQTQHKVVGLSAIAAVLGVVVGSFLTVTLLGFRRGVQTAALQEPILTA